MATEAPCNKAAKALLLSPSSSSCFITNLPDSILMEILCRLPIKTLAAYKSVCKSWLHLIRDPHFSQLHQARAPNQVYVFFQNLHDIYKTKLYMGNFKTLFELPRFKVSPKNVVKYKHVFECLHLANACNGLLCYFVKTRTVRHAMVWNPCTSEFITFPPPHIHKGFPNCRGYGLGFSRKANKFKILRLRDREVVTGSASEAVVVAEICAIEKACSWKIVDQLPVGYPIEFVSSGTYLGSTLHWAIAHNNEICILTFDFEQERFGRIQPPPKFGKTPTKISKNWNGEAESSSREILGVLRGFLIIADNRNQGVTVWSMKEYGVEDSWTKLFCFGYSPKYEKLHHIRSYLPIMYMSNGEILMTCTHTNTSLTTVFCYNPLLKWVRVLGSCYEIFSITAFRPSLVPLKDSMLGYDVHVKPRCVELWPGEMSTIPDWWRPSKGGWEW